MSVLSKPNFRVYGVGGVCGHIKALGLTTFPQNEMTVSFIFPHADSQTVILMSLELEHWEKVSSVLQNFISLGRSCKVEYNGWFESSVYLCFPYHFQPPQYSI